jgi:hypothetical protein
MRSSVPMRLPQEQKTWFSFLTLLSLRIRCFQQCHTVPFPILTYEKISLPQLLQHIDKVFRRIKLWHLFIDTRDYAYFERYDSMLVVISPTDFTPVTIPIFFPYLKKPKCGMPMILYRFAISFSCSVFNRPNATFPWNNRSNLLSRGSIALHGPHQGAQKSTIDKGYFSMNSSKFFPSNVKT